MEFIYDSEFWGRGIVLHLHRRARLSRGPQESRERARCPRASNPQRARGGALARQETDHGAPPP